MPSTTALAPCPVQVKAGDVAELIPPRRWTCNKSMMHSARKFVTDEHETPKQQFTTAINPFQTVLVISLMFVYTDILVYPIQRTKSRSEAGSTTQHVGHTRAVSVQLASNWNCWHAAASQQNAVQHTSKIQNEIQNNESTVSSSCIRISCFMHDILSPENQATLNQAEEELEVWPWSGLKVTDTKHLKDTKRWCGYFITEYYKWIQMNTNVSGEMPSQFSGHTASRRINHQQREMRRHRYRISPMHSQRRALHTRLPPTVQAPDKIRLCTCVSCVMSWDGLNMFEPLWITHTWKRRVGLSTMLYS